MQPCHANRNAAGRFGRVFTLALLSATLIAATPALAATVYWDTDTSTVGNNTDGTGLGGNGTWDTAASNWWDITNLVTWPNTSADVAVFTGPYVAGAPTASTVTLSSGIVANQLKFYRSGYTLTGGDLTLAGTTPGIYAAMGESVVINSQILGTAGLTLNGGGYVRLGNATNNYTGTTTIANGALVITNQAQLGGDTSAVVITGYNPVPTSTNLRGFGGGSLVLDGSTAGITFSRDLSLQGQGPIADRGAALISLGNNTLTGTVTGGAAYAGTNLNTRLISSAGTLTLSGTLNVLGTAATTITSLGGSSNQAGTAQYSLTGILAGTGTLEKSSTGTLFLNPSDTSGFSGTIRVSTSAASGQSSVRITSANVLGTRTATGTGGVLDLNSGILEVRMDTPSILAGGSAANVYQRADNSVIFVDHGLGSAAINGTATFGQFAFEDNLTMTLNGRNGYSVTFGAAPVVGSTAGDNNSTITNNLGGTLTFTGAFWSNSNNTGARTMTISGNGNTVITGDVTASAAAFDHVLTKTGSGSLTLTSTSATLDGNVNANGGAIRITDFRSLNMHTAGSNTGQINIGTTTTSGALIIGTSTAATAAGLTTSRTVNLAGTTGGASIYANQTGANPVIFNTAFTAAGEGAKTLTLGGTNTADNIINGAIVNNSGTNTTALTKIGTGTWVLAGANTYTGTTTIANGTLKLKANAATSTVLSSTNAITFNASNNYAGGTLEFVGQNGVNNVQSLGALGYSAGSNTVKLTPGTGGTASLTFSDLNTTGGSTVNFTGADFANNKITLTLVNGSAGGDGIVTRSVYFNGADFAYRQGGVLRAPNYGVDTGTATTASGPLTSGANQQITGNVATNSVSVPTLKIAGSQTLTINSGQTLTMSGAGVLVDGGNAVITGGTLATGSAALVVRPNLATDSLDLQSALTGTGGFTKSGAGTVILSGANSRTGNTNIDEGTVRLSGSGVLSGANVTTNIRQGATLDLNGVGTGTAIGSFNNNGTVTNSSVAAATLTIGNGNGTGTSYGIIQNGAGVINVTKVGTGNQSWLGSSTYTGVTTIGSTGLVTVDLLADGGAASGIGASSSAAANLVFDGSTGGLVYQGAIMDGNLTLGSRSASTDRLFTLSGTGVTLSSTASNGNAIVWSNTSAIVHGVVGPQSLVFTGTSTGDNTFNPQITDSGTGANITSLTKTAAGQWNLGNSNNTYTGVTTISEGTLGLNDNGALPANSPLALGTTTTSGILQMSGTFTRNLAATATAGNGTVTWTGTTGGGGFAAHTTQLVVAIGGLASPTALTWGSGGFVGTGGTQSLILGSSTALSDVDFRNAIDFGAAKRTVTINDNSNTGADFATLSGVLSGAGGGLQKTGSGVLRLTATNTYTGVTDINTGTLVVSSLGNSTTAGGSSVGATGVAMDNTNAITIGNASTSNAILQYVGAGEVSDRKIRINATTGSSAGAQIHADGTGALILTNVANDMVSDAGSKTLWLRGTNTAGNMITSQLSNNGGALNVTVDGGAAWILTNSSNNYTGTTTVSAGALGIGDNAALGSGILLFNNGNVFAYGADRTLANVINQSNNTTTGFIGDYSLSFGQVVSLAGANNWGTNNNIAAGKALTFAGLTADSITDNRTWTVDGSGTTIINGDITTTQTGARGINLTKTGNGVLQLNGTNSNFNRNNRVIDVDRGTLRIGANEVIPHGLDTQTTPVAYGGLTLSPELATGDTVVFDLNGFTETVNALTANTDGTVIIDNTSASAATFRFGANNSAVSFGTGTGTYSITNSGTGALSIVKMGNTATTIPTGVTLTYKGSTESEGGGSFTIASAVNGTSGLKATGGSTLALTGGITQPSLITSVEVGGGSILTLLDGAGSNIANLTSLKLGNTGSGTVTLNVNVGDGATDTFTLLTGYSANLGNTITFNMTDAGLSPGTTYTLLNIVDGGITAFGTGNMIQGATPGGFSGSTWTVTDNLVQFTTGTLITGASYWRGLAGGGTDTTWNANANNWSLDKANTSVATSIPGQGTDVVFAIDSASGAVNTTLEQNIKINSLTFEIGTTTPTSVTIAPGAVATNRLEVAPQLATDGVKITAGGPPSVTISAPFKLGANQTWNVVDAGSTLTFSGALFGEKDVTKTGLGKVTLSAAADPTFNVGQTSDFTVNGGTLEIQNVGALGTLAGSNLATVAINTGAAFYYNGASGTVANNLTLGGGTLSAGTGNHTYSGTVNISGNSFINMADSNGPATNTARNITLSGVVSGSGSLTIDSNNTASGGNQYNGTLTFNNAGNTWNGDLIFNEGTVTIASAASPAFTTNDVTFNSFGRFNLQGVNGQTLTRTGTLTYASGAIGELGVDNTSGTVSADFLVDQNGAVTLGSGGTGANVRLYLSDAFSKLNITGGVTLGGNSSISVSGDAAGVATISSVISDGGNAYALAVNDDAAGWAATNRTLRLTGLNTFTGNVALGEGTLEFNTVTNVSGGASSLGNGTAITLNGGTLRFIGDTTNQSTDRPITTTAATTLSANGTGGASITYSGAITIGPTGDGTQFSLTGASGSTGVIAGGFTMTGDSADMTVTGGTWSHQTGTSRVADSLTFTGGTLNLDSGLFQVRNDFIVSASGAVLNLNGTGVLSFNTATLSGDASLRAYAGGVINFGADNPVVATEFDSLRIGTDTTGGGGTLNMNAFNQTTTEFTLGNRHSDRFGIVNGTGTLTVTGNLDLYNGTFNANLASTGTGSLEKHSTNTVTLTGDNSGLTSTGSNILYAGMMVLDYTTSNTTKLRAASALDMRGATLQILGNNAAATSQSAGSFTLGSGGASTIQVVAGAGQTAVLNLGAITRANGSSDGTVLFLLPSGAQSSTNGITTTTANGSHGLLGSSAFAIVNDGTGLWFATNNGSGNIVAQASTVKNDVTTWATGDHITDSTGFTGTATCKSINSLRFDAAAGSDLSIANGSTLNIASGGILVTSNVGGTPSIMGGTLVSGTQELIIHQESGQVFEIGSAIRGGYAVTKSGNGTLRLSGNNVYSDETEILAGTLQVGGGNAIGDTSSVTLAAYEDSTLQLLANETIGRLGGGQRQDGDDHGLVAIGANTLTINQTATANYSGFITGTGTLVLAASGNFNLNMNNVSSGFTGSVIVQNGLLQLSGVGRIDASAITINNGGALLLDKNGTTTSGAQILDTTAIILNSAVSSSTVAGGLWIRRDQGSTQSETVGVVTAASGASYVRAETSTTSAVTVLSAENVLRLNNATLSIRGNTMAATSGRRAQFRIIAANESAFISALTGGGGAAGSATMSIVPWAIAEDNGTGSITATNMGNSLATYVATSGFRPLDFATEYATYATAGATNNTRESLTVDLTGLAGRTLNSLTIHNNNTAASAINVTGSGAGQTLTNTSGVFLFTLNSGATASSAHTVGLSGFDAGVTAGGSEYIFYVVNPSFAATTATLSATIASPLTSSADITKSGRGTLILSGTNTAGGGTKKTTLNEGVLEIADLDNIGGNSGGMVFAGGTLRLGTTLTDDISSRAISYLLGGGTIDTNGVNLTLAGSLGSGAGGFTKIGAGNLTLNGTATYLGNTTISAGTITIGANNALGNGGDLTIGAGATLAFSAANTLTHGLVTTTGLDPVISGTGTITAATGFYFNNTDTAGTTVNATLAGSGGLLKAQSNTLLLTGANTYTGTTEVYAGTVNFNSIGNVGGGASALGAPATVEDGIIRMGLTTATTTLDYTGSGHSTNRIIALQGTTGGVTIYSNGTGALALGTIKGANAGTKTLTLDGSATGFDNTVLLIDECVATLNLAKTGASTWLLNGVNTYSGTTNIDQGTLKIGIDNSLPGTTAVRIGTGSTAGTLNLNGFDQTIGALRVQSTTNAVINNIIITAGKTLTVNGAVTLGADADASSTAATFSGGGSLVVNSGGANFQVGGATGGTNDNKATVDLSSLASFTANLGAGVFRLGDANSGVEDNTSTLRLATDNTITASMVRIGDGSGGGITHTMTLGSGTNVINADTINVGSAGNTIRSGGAVVFDAGDTTGTVKFRASDGTSRTTLNIINTSGTTAGDMVSNVNFAGHSADLLVGALTMASRSANSGNATATFTFDQGTLDVTTLTMASRTGAGSGAASATLNLGDSATAGIPTVNIGALNMAIHTSTGTPVESVTADLNITGGNVTIGSGSGTAINMANAGTGRTATSTIDLTGGTVDITGNIVRTGGAGTENATVTLDGATLDMNGFSIGSATQPITLTAQSGTLQNLAELNGGGTLTKTSTGTLTLDTANSYTGSTVVSAGVLAISHGSALGGTANGTSIAPSGTLTLSNGITVAGETLSLTASNAGEAILSSQSGNNTWTGNLTVDTGADTSYRVRILSAAGSNLLVGGNITFSAGTADFVFGGDGNGEFSGTFTGSQRLFKSSVGAGTWIISGDNSSTFTGKIVVGNGTLQVSSENNLGVGPVSAAADQLRLGGGTTQGTLHTTASISLNGNRGVTLGAGGGIFDVDPSTTLTVHSNVTGSGSLTKTGDGILLLAGASNDYSGGTAINGGKLDVTGSGGSATGTGTVTVNTGGTLQGSGVIGGLVQLNGGALSVDVNGLLLDSGLTTLSGGGQFQTQFASLSNYSQLLVNSGGVDIGSGIVGLTTTGLDTLVPSGDVYFWIINNTGGGSYNGNFAGLSNGSQIAGTQYYIYYGADYGGSNPLSGGGNDVVITNVPEPSTIAMFGGMGLIGLGIYWRRRQREAARQAAYAHYRKFNKPQAA